MTDCSASAGFGTPSLLDAAIPCIALIVLLGLSYFLFGNDASSGPNQIALLFCGTIAAGIAYKNGKSWDGIRQAVVDGIAIGLLAFVQTKLASENSKFGQLLGASYEATRTWLRSRGTWRRGSC